MNSENTRREAHIRSRCAKRTTASRRSFRNAIRCFDQAAAMFLRFLRQASRPSAPTASGGETAPKSLVPTSTRNQGHVFRRSAEIVQYQGGTDYTYLRPVLSPTFHKIPHFRQQFLAPELSPFAPEFPKRL